MAGLLSVGEAARQLGANPKDISDLFYRRELRDDLCPIVGGRRVIPGGYLDAIRSALKRRGRIVVDSAKRGAPNHSAQHRSADAGRGFGK